MQVNVTSVADLGLVTRAVRKQSGLRLDDTAGCSGLSKQFVSDVERGKDTVRLGLVFQLLGELGIRLTVHVPDAAEDTLAALREKGVRPVKRRAVAGGVKSSTATATAPAA